MRRWMGIVLPPFWSLFMLLLVVGAISVPLLGVFSPEYAASTNLTLHLILLAGCFFYGSFRALAFHPIFRPGYRFWLVTSPWTDRLPLPLGPIHLVVQDAVIVALAVAPLVAATRRIVPHFQFVLPVLMFLLPYLGSLTLLFYLTGLKRLTCGLLFGFGVMLHLYPNTNAVLVTAALLYLPAYWGIRRTLAQRLWEGDEAEEASRVPWELEKLFTRELLFMRRELGWPYDWFFGVKTQPRLTAEAAVWIGLLAAWWFYVVAVKAGDISGFYRFLIGAFALGRFAIYWGLTFYPPISLLGRLAASRGILRGYDQVFLAPLCSAVIGFVTPPILIHFGVGSQFALPISLFASLLAALKMGPSLARWQLTGSHRIVPHKQEQSGFEEI